ncbi:MAG: dual specificity protein phosphatase family protein [Rhodospirillales bacterium]|nr:dual specificity protein phosphatase family protein [Rhodospirillales bacterium]
MLPLEVTVCAEAEVCDLIDGHTHALSITDPGSWADIPPCIPPSRVLRLQFHDLDAPPSAVDPAWTALYALGARPILPAARHIRAVIAFADALGKDARVLIHCKAGISRSTAAAAIIGCRLLPRRESEVFAHISHIRPQALPNRRMVRLADRILGAGGRMIRARA